MSVLKYIEYKINSFVFRFFVGLHDDQQYKFSFMEIPRKFIVPFGSFVFSYKARSWGFYQNIKTRILRLKIVCKSNIYLGSKIFLTCLLILFWLFFCNVYHVFQNVCFVITTCNHYLMNDGIRHRYPRI